MSPEPKTRAQVQRLEEDKRQRELQIKDLEAEMVILRAAADTTALRAELAKRDRSLPPPQPSRKVDIRLPGNSTP